MSIGNLQLQGYWNRTDNTIASSIMGNKKKIMGADLGWLALICDCVVLNFCVLHSYVLFIFIHTMNSITYFVFSTVFLIKQWNNKYTLRKTTFFFF